MLKKAALKTALKLWNKGGFTVQFWDGEEKDYGSEKPKFKIIFHREPKMSDITGMKGDLIMTLGQAYMDGSIDFEGSLDDVIATMFKNQTGDAKKYDLDKLKKKMLSGVEEQEKENIHSHYDLGNDFYAKWLDKTMSYSCAYFEKPDNTLEEAQLNKIDHSLKKLLLKPGETLLDIGCGWGRRIVLRSV